MRIRWIVVGVLIVAALVVVALVIPYGLKAKEPQAKITVFLEDMGTGQTFSAQVTVGEPSNGLSMKKPAMVFKPLAAWESNQTVKVYSTHQYKIWISVSVDYKGDKIKIYNKAEAAFMGRSGTYYLLNDEIMCAPDIPDKMAVHVSQIPVTASPITIGMNSNDPFFGAGSIDGSDWAMYLSIYGSPQVHHEPPLNGVHFAGIGIEGISLECTINIYGTANDGTAQIGTVDAKLLLHADTSASGGSVSVSVVGMSASVTESA